MANAYATLASGGIRNRPKAIKRVVFPDGKSEDLGKPVRKRVLTDGEADEVTQILEANVYGGTGTAAQIGCPAAGKTGTTDEFQRRLVRGLHAAPLDRRVGGLSRHAGVDGGHAHRLSGRRHVAGANLARLHDHGARRRTATTSRSPPSPPSSRPSSASTRTPARRRPASTTAPPRPRTTPDEKYDPRFYEEAPLDPPETETPSEEAPPTETPAPENGDGEGDGNGGEGTAAPG